MHGAQRALRQYFGIPTPAAEHRAMDDVGVLSALVAPLLAASAAPSLQHLMAATMSNGVAGTYAGLVSHVLPGRGQGALTQRLWLHTTEHTLSKPLKVQDCVRRTKETTVGRQGLMQAFKRRQPCSCSKSEG